MSKQKKSVTQTARFARLAALLLPCLCAALVWQCAKTPEGCGNGSYDPKTHFCSPDETIVKKCGGSEYDPADQFCDNSGNTVLDKCGGDAYNTAVEFCDSSSGSGSDSGGTVRPLCNGEHVYPCDDTDTTGGGTDTVGTGRFTVTFNTNGGTPAALNPVAVDSAGILGTYFPADPTKAGNTFDGWFDPAGAKRYTDTTAIFNDITLTAKWTDTTGAVTPGATTFTVTFNTNGGTPATIGPVTVDSAGMMGTSFPADPTKAGSVFGGWFDGGSIRYYATTPIVENTALIALWNDTTANKTTTYIVWFNTNGGTPATISPVTVDSAGMMGTSFPADPAKTGHIFDGWFDTTTTPPTRYTGATVIISNVTLTATWTPVKCTVSFNTNGGTPTPIAPITTDYGATLKTDFPADPTKTGHTFAGWFDGGEQYNAASAITKNVTLTATWATNPVTVKFNTNGGTPATVDPVTVSHGDSLGAKLPTATATTKTGHTFAGWFAGETEYKTSTPITQDTTLTAKWILNSYTVKFNTDGGTPTVPDATVNHGESLGTKLPTNTEKTGHTLTGWFAGETEYKASTQITDTVTLTAKWTLNQYTVKFNTDGGTPTVSDATVNHGDPLGTKLPTATVISKIGHNLTGWHDKNDGNKEYNAATPITGEITLTAAWTIKKYTVTFDLKGATSNPIAPVQVDSAKTLGDQLPKDNPTRKGYDFNGWLVGEAEYTPEFQIHKDTALTAKWEIQIYTIKFDANGGTVTPEEGKTGNGWTLTSLPTPTRNGYTFDAWYTTQTTGGVKVTNTTAFEGNATIYARWNIIKYKVKFVTGTGTSIPDAETDITKNYRITAPTTALTKAFDPRAAGVAEGLYTAGNYTFVQWEINGNAFDFNTTAITKDTTLTAKWEAPAVPLSDGTENLLVRALAHINAQTSGSYFLLLGTDVTITGTTLVKYDLTIIGKNGAKITEGSNFILQSSKVTFENIKVTRMAVSEDSTVTLSGTTTVDELTLRANENARSYITIAAGWTGSVGNLDLRVDYSDMQFTWWRDKLIVKPVATYSLTKGDIEKITLRHFTCNTSVLNTIEGDIGKSKLVNEGPDIGKLVAK